MVLIFTDFLLAMWWGPTSCWKIIYLWLKIDFLIGLYVRISDLLEKGRIYWCSSRVLNKTRIPEDKFVNHVNVTRLVYLDHGFKQNVQKSFSNLEWFDHDVFSFKLDETLHTCCTEDNFWKWLQIVKFKVQFYKVCIQNDYGAFPIFYFPVSPDFIRYYESREACTQIKLHLLLFKCFSRGFFRRLFWMTCWKESIPGEKNYQIDLTPATFSLWEVTGLDKSSSSSPVLALFSQGILLGTFGPGGPAVIWCWKTKYTWAYVEKSLLTSIKPSEISNIC